MLEWDAKTLLEIKYHKMLQLKLQRNVYLPYIANNYNSNKKKPKLKMWRAI